MRPAPQQIAATKRLEPSAINPRLCSAGPSREVVMGPGYFVIAILGCADGGRRAPRSRPCPARYESEAPCAAATGGGARRQQRLRFPDHVAECRAGQVTGAGARSERRGRITAGVAAGLSAMTDVVEPMIREDALPGHESQLEPKPDWEPRYHRLRPPQGQGRADHRRRQRHRPRGRGAVRPRRRRRRHPLSVRA